MSYANTENAFGKTCIPYRNTLPHSRLIDMHTSGCVSLVSFAMTSSKLLCAVSLYESLHNYHPLSYVH